MFHLVAEEVEHEFAPGLKATCWGYNGSVHGPLIEAVEGDRVRLFVTNRLPAPTSVHWHGLLLPNGMDGVGGLTQRAIKPWETFKYEFTLRQAGTCMYHAHHDEMTQIGLGMTGLFVIHPPARPAEPSVDRDFALMLHEWRIDPGTSRPNPNEMTDFNVLTINAKAFPGTAPLVVRTGERVRIRIGNLSPMDHHPMHLHGYRFVVTETDGGRVPESARWPETTVLVPVGSTRNVEFVADEPGDWAFHCHMTHHVMNQMGHGLPNMIGVKPGAVDGKVQPLLPGYMTMGQAVADLRAAGVEHVVMLTGDNRGTAAAIAQETGVDEVHAELLPADKVAKVEELVAKYGSVAMIGDGVNDAPAMGRATVAVAMGAIGTDAAIETADIALMSDDLRKLPWLVRHSRRALGIIRQNIAFALAVKAVFVVLTLCGHSSMWAAVAADSGATLLVVFNALRLLRK